MSEIIVPHFMPAATTSTNDDGRCPVCHGSGWELYTVSARELEYVYGDAAEDMEYARKCTRCLGIKPTEDLTGAPDTMREADIYKFDFSCYGVNTAKLKQIVFSMFERYKEWAQKGKGLYIYSKTPGSGKTFLACCLGKSIMMKYGIQFKFVTAPDYIDKVSEGYTLAKQGIPDSPAEVYKTCDLLVIDDIGAQIGKEWQTQELFKLINSRISQGLVTIYTSNLDIDKLNVDERIRSRIYGSSIMLPMPEVSVRTKKANEAQDAFLNGIL